MTSTGASTGGKLTVAIEGCCHGELDAIYRTVLEASHRGVNVDLVLICGDFQCTRYLLPSLFSSELVPNHPHHPHTL